jgi:predicted PurR-regulated permease PerM
MNEIKTIKRLLLIIVIPVAFYVLHILKFIFIPLLGSIMLALLFMPMMRWMAKKRFPKFLAVVISVVLMILGVSLAFLMLRLSAQEILSADSGFWEKLTLKLDVLFEMLLSALGAESIQGMTKFSDLLQNENVTGAIFSQSGATIGILGNTVTMLLMTLFFLVLLIAESLNVQQIMGKTIFKRQNMPSIRTYRQIEKSMVKFIKVKFILSLATGIGFSLACLYFDVSFPLFWGVFTFAINFVQMIGSIISTVLLTLFALAEMEPSGTLLMFALTITGVQVLFGSILEPIMMGKTFSINTVTVLVMLMFWGFIWGIPGMILSIPVTVLIKTILEQFPKTRLIANIMS